jgi:hypothetical protein
VVLNSSSTVLLFHVLTLFEGLIVSLNCSVVVESASILQRLERPCPAIDLTGALVLIHSHLLDLDFPSFARAYVV